MLGSDKVGVVLDERLVNVDKGRWGRNAFGDGETEPMRLIGSMIRICGKKETMSAWGQERVDLP
jgi:hypothetical protein